MNTTENFARIKSLELDNWSELFDKHDIMRRKAMLYNIIERIDVWRGRIEIIYKIRLDAFAGKQDESENCEISESVANETDLDGKIFYNTFDTNVSMPHTMQISQRREVMFATPSGRQTSKERKCLAVK